MTISLKRLAIKGTAWTTLSYVGSQGLRFGSNLILTRLLVPEYFGLMALVNTFRQGLELFSDIGIGQNIVRSERGDDPVFLNTAWTIQAVRGIALWLVFSLLAWPVSRFYQEPVLFRVLLVIGITLVLDGFKSTTLFNLTRHVALGKVSLFNFTAQLASIGTMIAIAWFYPSIWALVIGAIVGSLFKLAGSFLLFPGHRHEFIIEPEARQEIVAFGRWIFLSSIVMFMAEQSDRIILGKLVPLEFLGIYSIAYVLANMPQKLMKQMSSQVIFPLVSKQIHLPRPQLKKRINKQRWKLHSILLLIYLTLAGFGDMLIRLLYDPRYEQAAWMMPLLALGGWFSSLFFIADPCILALGKSIYSAQSRVFRLISVTIGLLLGFKLFGLFGAVLVIALADLPSYLAIQYGLYREGICGLMQDLRSTLVFALLLGGVYGLRQLAGLGLPFDVLTQSP